MTFAFALTTDFPFWKVIPYIGAQVLGGIVAGTLVLLTFQNVIARYEENNNNDYSPKTAMILAEFFPNPRIDIWQQSDVTHWNAFAIEAWGTCILMFVIRVVTNKKNNERPPDSLVPYVIGFTISSLMMLYAPITQGCFNPARDFGPRLVAFFGGWRNTAIPGPRGGGTDYL